MRQLRKRCQLNLLKKVSAQCPLRNEMLHPKILSTYFCQNTQKNHPIIDFNWFSFSNLQAKYSLLELIRYLFEKIEAELGMCGSKLINCKLRTVPKS